MIFGPRVMDRSSYSLNDNTLLTRNNLKHYYITLVCYAVSKSKALLVSVHIGPIFFQFPKQRDVFAGGRSPRHDKLFTKQRPVARRFAEVAVRQRHEERQHEAVAVVVVLAVGLRGPTFLLAHLP